MTTSSTSDLEMIEVKPGKKFSINLLKEVLPDTETALFFAKAYRLDHKQLGNLLSVVLNSTTAKALLSESGEHSHELQDYLVDEIVPFTPGISRGKISTGHNPPQGEILPHLWEQLEVVIARSIQEVADKIATVVDALPGKQGSMVFRSLMVMNAKRPTFGDHKAQIHHAPQKQNLVIFDVSGSMSRPTVEAIVEDVVALSYKANAHFAIVSNTMTYWEPGTYTVADVLAHAEFGGTQYQELRPVLDMDWGTVITIADYDSSLSAKQVCLAATGSADEVLDVSLVNQPTFLAECLGGIAARTRPILVAADTTRGVLGNEYRW